jgi:chaperonin GroEL (HSP60 family)
MLNEIEIKLIDDKGNYSIAHINYKGYVDMLVDHNIDMVYDALQAMVEDYTQDGKLEILKRDPIAAHEAKGAPHKH